VVIGAWANESRARSSHDEIKGHTELINSKTAAVKVILQPAVRRRRTRSPKKMDRRNQGERLPSLDDESLVEIARLEQMAVQRLRSIANPARRVSYYFQSLSFIPNRNSAVKF
jgi:hypothetical protein